LEYYDARWWSSDGKPRWAHGPPNDPPGPVMVGDAGSSKDGRFATQLFQMPKGKAGEQMINSARITEILKSI